MGVAQVVAGQRLTASLFNQLPAIVSSMATASVSSSVTETAIGTFTLAAGDPLLSFPGGYWFEAFGSAAETASPLLSIRVRLNSTAGTLLLQLAGATVSTTPSYFGITGKILLAAVGSSGSFGAYLSLTSNFGGSGVVTPGIAGAVAINTTVSNTILVTAQWGTTSASNVATGTGGSMYRL